MCGIVGAISQRNISRILLEGLRRLEYRGYDSAGMAVINQEGTMQRVRMQGKVQSLADALQKQPLQGVTGIAHTRWATHGKPSEYNAHPHVSHDEIAVVHNGIIENYEKLREALIAKGYQFTSETDTEVIAHLLHDNYQTTQNMLTAVQLSAAAMQGAFALCIIHKNYPEEMLAVRKGSPLVIGSGIGENFIASDALALRSFAHTVIYLEEGDIARVHQDGVELFNAAGESVTRKAHPFSVDAEIAGKGKYRHFMLKEIFEQPKIFTDALEGRVNSLALLKSSFGMEAISLFEQAQHIHIVACGTSYHAAMIAKYWLEAVSGLPTQVEIASEYRYRDIVIPERTLFIAVSQSGETADTLAALYKAKTSQYLGTLAICNVATSTLCREADCTFLTRAGLEIGVASTKAFTTQLIAFLLLAAVLCPDERTNDILQQLQSLPQVSENTLKMNDDIESLAALFVNKTNALFLGRGAQYSVALEGALKLKEISYIHAEAYPAGELKHGPLALIDENMPVIAVAPNDELLDKLKSNLHEVASRGGQLFVFADAAEEWKTNQARIIKVPSCGIWIAPIIYTIPLQLLAYHVAVAKGTDVDQPRNLAKSVTVE